MRLAHRTMSKVYPLTKTGIAAGSKRGLVEIIALNVRTEIVFGQFSDGCTSVYYQGDGVSLQGQNWDVRPTQLFIPHHSPLS